MAAHPEVQEACYSGAQMLNIVHAVVPKHEILDAQIKLALAHLGDESVIDLAPARSV